MRIDEFFFINLSSTLLTHIFPTIRGNNPILWQENCLAPWGVHPMLGFGGGMMMDCKLLMELRGLQFTAWAGFNSPTDRSLHCHGFRAIDFWHPPKR
jgi:hypothetical protein